MKTGREGKGNKDKKEEEDRIKDNIRVGNVKAEDDVHQGERNGVGRQRRR